MLALTGNYVSGNIYWVSSATGNDSNAGTEPELPKATLVSALTVAVAGDTILCASGHAEVISAAQTLSANDVMIIGMGVGSSRAQFTSNVAGVALTVSGAHCSLWNTSWPASTAATTTRIASTSTEFGLFGSYMALGTNDTTNGVTLAGNNPALRDCDFAAVASRPARAVNVTGAITGAWFEDVSFDGGAYGWSSPAFGITAAATRVFMNNVRLANRSDFVATATGTSYRCFGLRAVDNTGSRIVIAA